MGREAAGLTLARAEQREGGCLGTPTSGSVDCDEEVNERLVKPPWSRVMVSKTQRMLGSFFVHSEMGVPSLLVEDGQIAATNTNGDRTD
ncbi:hypothetical protein MLD38_037367 [Melastoma candidum]|uniref:Uncharacterized protein n=1 Tax=Melastoma candidum TaxID=119954 RepID=A0ACB9LN37_9MYRT|nr:hypothetical protein MLD38_037367 [Melastoma candidum]